jgi:amylosucrase
MVYSGVQHILARRKAMPEFHAGNPTLIADTGQVGLFAFVRRAPTGAVVCIYNFTEFWANLRHEWAYEQGARAFEDGLSEQHVALDGGRILLPPYARLWLR